MRCRRGRWRRAAEAGADRRGSGALAREDGGDEEDITEDQAEPVHPYRCQLVAEDHQRLDESLFQRQQMHEAEDRESQPGPRFEATRQQRDQQAAEDRFGEEMEQGIAEHQGQQAQGRKALDNCDFQRVGSWSIRMRIAPSTG